MYKALIDIGDYKKGEEVPADKAEIWSTMYVVSPVEKDGKTSVKEVKPTEKPVEESANPFLDDYLARNEFVVKKNLKKDKLSLKNVEALLKLEQSGKKRRSIIKLLESKR